MRIEQFRVYRYSLPLREPLLLRGNAHTRRDGLLVEVVTETGSSGWGEIAPLPGFSRESLEEAERQVCALRPNLIGLDLDACSGEAEIPMPNGLAPAPSVRFGIGLVLSEAEHAANARSHSPEAAHGIVAVNALLTVGGAAAARGLVDAGYRSIKVKVGRASVREDVCTVREVIEAAGEDARVRLDANRSWSFEDAVAFVTGLQDLPYEYIEEPLTEAGQLREFVAQTGARVALDESLAGIPPDALGDHRFAAAVVLKPTILGGLPITAAYAKQAQACGMKPVISAAYESGVGIRAMALLALHTGLAGTPMGLDTYRRLVEDVWTPPLNLESGGFGVADLLDDDRCIRRALLREIL